MFKKQCLLCGCSTKTYLCDDCLASLPWNSSACTICALPLSTGSICGSCLQKPPYFQRTISLFTYQKPIDYLVGQFKFQQQLLYGKVLSQLLSTKLQLYYQQQNKPRIILPIPLHRKRLIERGFNQSVELAKPIAKKLKIKLNRTSAQRIINTQHQTELAIKERAKNIRNAFTIEKLADNHVAVIDDVITSGHTINEFCRHLHKQGVTQIDVWCIARTNLT